MEPLGIVSSGYYAPLSVSAVFSVGAWTLFVGTTPDGKYVVEYHSAASSRYQRRYFDSETEALGDVESFGAKP